LFKCRPGDSAELVGLDTRGSRGLLQRLGSRAMWAQMLRGELKRRRLPAWPRVWFQAPGGTQNPQM
jgi:hypothetical protein